MATVLEKGAHFVWSNARLLDRAIFEYFFLGGSPDRVLSVLSLYQNDDGGFGHALEPDLRAPDSQPLFVEFALRTLYDCHICAPDLAYRVCDFLAQHSDLVNGIPTIFPSSQLYPRAPHWNNPSNQQPSLDRLIGLVGMVNWQGISHPWLPAAVETCLKYIDSQHFDDAHTILTAFCLLESISAKISVDSWFDKLSKELLSASFFNLNAPVKSYGLTPLDFASSPASFCRKIFTDEQINGHLEDLLQRQQPDGGWSILWEPPSEMARQEWRAQKTVMALSTLRNYKII